jgi:hypothetical protein
LKLRQQRLNVFAGDQIGGLKIALFLEVLPYDLTDLRKRGNGLIFALRAGRVSRSIQF